jgi:hypothetical protein
MNIEISEIHKMKKEICVGYSESNLLWASNKTSNEENYIIYIYIYIYIYINKYILKLHLDAVTTGTEAVVSRNKFLYACVKEVCACEVSHILTRPLTH